MTTIENRTPEETPAAIARAIATLACAPVRDFVSCISDEDNTRDHLDEQLVARLTADESGAWSQAKADDVDERLRASLATSEDRDLFNTRVDHGTTRETIQQEAAFLLGVEVGRRTQEGQPEAESPSTTGRSVEDAMLHVVSVLHLVKVVVDSQLGNVATINRDAFYALRDLLEETATGLDAAHGRYCTESNALHAAAESGGAA